MPDTVKTRVISGVAFGGFMAAFFTIQHGPLIGLPCGVLAGLIFAASHSIFARHQASKFKGQCPLADGETLLKDGPANHFVRVEGVGGWLYLTSSRLYFRSHKMNIQNHELSIPLERITTVSKSLTAGIIPNGLIVESANGKDRFVVSGARSWAAAIEEAKSAPGRKENR